MAQNIKDDLSVIDKEGNVNFPVPINLLLQFQADTSYQESVDIIV